MTFDELATEHYRFRNIARNVLAGFSIYPRSQEAHKLTHHGELLITYAMRVRGESRRRSFSTLHDT